MTIEYSPFGTKKIIELVADDLFELRNAREGWYIEYKSSLPSTKDVAKALSAFANTYGGWLFFGVSEESKFNNVAGSFPGLKYEILDTSIQKIRQAAQEYLNPTPHFETHVVLGPCSLIGLDDGHGVICVRIPQSVLAPHVHASGVIYRRVSDSSEPKAEADVRQLQSLWDRRSKENEKYEKWIDRSPELSKGEEDRPIIRILMDGDLYGLQEGSLDLSVQEVGNTLNDASSGPSLPLEAVFPSSRGIVARQTSSLERHESLGMTWLVKGGLQSEILLPLNVYSYDTPFDLLKHLGQYSFTSRFVEILTQAKSSESRVIDLNQLLAILTAVASMEIRLLRKSNIDLRSIHAKVILINVWRVVPFLDSSIVLEKMARSGLPLCLTSEAVVPW
jgi:hypothetical protein